MADQRFRVVIFHNPEKPAASRELPRLKNWLKRHGLAAVPLSQARQARWAVALGGDGTLLGAARQTASLGLPVLGVNLGRLGFLSGTDLKHLYKTLGALVRGKLPIQSRMMLQVEPPRGKNQFALNDCVIRASSVSRLIRLSVWVDGHYVATYAGDGLILSTPTGSTAYSLAAFGPIIQPEMDLILLTPICSHSLTQRPVILSPNSRVDIRVEEKGRRDKVMLSLDGQINFSLQVGDKFSVRRSPDRFRIYDGSRQSYFSRLRQKLKWGER